MVTALRLLNNEIDKGNKHSIPEINKDDLHTDDRPSWEVDGTTLTTNNRFSVLSNCETVDEENVTTNGTILTTNNRLPVQGNRETIDKENESTRSQPKKGAKLRTQPESVLIIGDSLIKNIDSQKLTKKTVDKRMYSGKTSDQICHEVDSIHIDVKPSHVIIHSGTNNLPSDSVESCVSKTENLALKIRNKFQSSKIGISSLTHREDISVSTKLSEVNGKLKEMSTRNGFHFIDNSHIDGSCLNGSKLHLNSKGSAYLATSFMLCRSVYAHGFTAGQKTVENQDWATGPRSRRAAGPPGRRAAGPSGRWAVAGRGPAFSKTPLLEGRFKIIFATSLSDTG